MATYYVDFTGGLDANDGTSMGTAWKTISKVNASAFLAGDQILFKRGEMWREQLTIPSSGATGNRITFGAYGSGAKPIINGADIKTGWTNAGSNQWWINNPNPTTTQAMVIIGGTIFTEENSLANVNSAGKYFIDTTATPDRLYVYSTVDPATLTAEISARLYGVVTASGASSKTHIVVQDIEVRYAGRGGIYFEGPGESTSDTLNGDSIVERCTVYANRTFGVVAFDHYDNCIFRNNTGSFNGNGFYAWVADEITMQDNYHSDAIHYSIGAGFTDGGAFQGYQSDNCIIERNTSERDFDSIHIDAGNLAITGIIRYNKAYNSKFGTGGEPNTPCYGFGNLAVGGTISIYYNLGVNGASSAIECYSTILGTVNIWNNTFYCDASHATDGLTYFANTSNISIKNNLFVRDYVAGEFTFVDLNVAKSSDQDYNLYFFTSAGANPTLRNWWNGAAYTTMATWRSATSLDTNSLTVDPLFVNIASDWSIQSSSPAINAGISVGLTQDIDGNPIVGNPDIGAYEYTEAAPPSGITLKGRRIVVA